MVLVESKRDQRVLDWLIAQVGEQAVADACGQLIGSRRLYPSNVAKVLGLTPPESLLVASDDDARRYLVELARLLGIGGSRESDDGDA